MRFLAFGPRIFGIRTGISFSLRDLAWLFGSTPVASNALLDPDSSFIYVVKGDHNRVKIGITSNPIERLNQLRTASAFPLEYAWIGAPQGQILGIENDAHAMLSAYRRNGEWFDIAPDAAVGTICSAAQRRGQNMLSVSLEQAEQIRLVAAAELAKQQATPHQRVIALLSNHMILYYVISVGILFPIYFIAALCFLGR